MIIRSRLAGDLALYDLPPDLAATLRGTFSLPNPAYAAALKNGARRLPPTHISFARAGRDALYVPRHGYHLARAAIHMAGHVLKTEDARTTAEPIDFPTLLVPPTPAQAAAVEATDHDGLIVAPAGSGKTNAGIYAIARRRRRALWLTHTGVLAEQTTARIKDVLGLSGDAVGLLGDGKRRYGTHITVGMVQTLAKMDPGELAEVGARHGMIVVDECHHLPAGMFAGVMRGLTSRHLLGLTATPKRRDGLDDLLHWLIGPTLVTMGADDLRDRLIRPRIVRLATHVDPGDVGGWTDMVTALTRHPGRNQRILGLMQKAIAEGRRPIALTSRIEHAEELTRLAVRASLPVCLLHGSLPKKARDQAVERLHNGTYRGVVATTSLVGEGFDAPYLDTLILATPLSWSGTLAQLLGRVSRTHPGKADAVVYDLVDDHGMAESSAQKRLAHYSEMEVA